MGLGYFHNKLRYHNGSYDFYAASRNNGRYFILQRVGFNLNAIFWKENDYRLTKTFYTLKRAYARSAKAKSKREYTRHEARQFPVLNLKGGLGR